MTCGSHLLDTRETVDDESYKQYIPGVTQQYTYSALGVTNSPYKRRGPPRGASLLFRDSAVIRLLLPDSTVIRLLFRDSAVIRLLLRDSAVSRNNHYSFGTRHIHSVLIIKSPVKLHPRGCQYAIRVEVTRPKLPHPSANLPRSPEANDFDC